MKAISSKTGKRQRNREFWNQHIQNQTQLNITQVQYCFEQNLKKTTFQYWKARLKQEENSKSLIPVTITPTAKPVIDPHCTGNSSRLVSGIHLSVKGRFVVELEDQFSASALSKLIGILEAI